MGAPILTLARRARLRPAAAAGGRRRRRSRRGSGSRRAAGVDAAGVERPAAAAPAPAPRRPRRRRSRISPASTPGPRCDASRANSARSQHDQGHRREGPHHQRGRQGGARRRLGRRARAARPAGSSRRSTSPNSGRSRPKPLSRIKKISGPRLHASWVNIPHVTHTDEADVTELEAFRKSLDDAAKADKKAPYRVSLLPLLMKASVATLKAFPTFNSAL